MLCIRLFDKVKEGVFSYISNLVYKISLLSLQNKKICGEIYFFGTMQEAY